jgi:hypothetical protein
MVAAVPKLALQLKCDESQQTALLIKPCVCVNYDKLHYVCGIKDYRKLFV